MSINPVLLNATIQRVQDFSNLKQNIDQKSAVEQSMIQHTMEKHDAKKANQVMHQDNADMMNKKFDARERGSNSYQGDGGKNRQKKKQSDTNGSIVRKGTSGGFDMKV